MKGQFWLRFLITNPPFGLHWQDSGNPALVNHLPVAVWGLGKQRQTVF